MTMDILTRGVPEAVSLPPISIVPFSVLASFLDRFLQFQPYLLTAPSLVEWKNTSFLQKEIPFSPQKTFLTSV